MNRTVLLGLGAHKAGTTWLRTLRVRPRGAAIRRDAEACFGQYQTLFGADLIDRLWPSTALLDDRPVAAAGKGAA